MADLKFSISRYIKNSVGSYVIDGSTKSLEDDFGCIRYKSMTGINSRGKQKGLYVETYAESNSARVYFASSPTKEQTSCTLTVCVFGADPLLSTSLSVTEQIKTAENTWHTFCDWLEGHFLLWYDDYRQRKALFYLEEVIEPASDVIKGVPYLQCAIKLSNVFGQTFGVEDNTIENWLKNGGKDVN